MKLCIPMKCNIQCWASSGTVMKYVLYRVP